MKKKLTQELQKNKGVANQQVKPQNNVMITDYYHVKKNDMRFENDSSFSQSQNNEDMKAEQSNINKLFTEKDLKNEIKKEEQLRLEIEQGIAQFKNSEIQKNTFDTIPSQISKELTKPEISVLQQQNSLFENPMISTVQMTTTSPNIPVSTIVNSQSASTSDFLSDFLRSTQQYRKQLQKNNLNFHNTISFDKSLNKNLGGTGPNISNFYSLSSHLKQPKDIVLEKTQKYKVSSPDDMRQKSLLAQSVMDYDREARQRTFDIRSRHQQSRDISYKIDAARSKHDENLRKSIIKDTIVESSIDNLKNLNEEERVKLLGIIEKKLPEDLKTIDKLINDRNLLITDIKENMQESENRAQSTLQSVKPSNRVEFQIMRPSRQTQNNFFSSINRGFKKQQSTSQLRSNGQDLSMPSIMTMPHIKQNSVLRNMSSASSTFNININTNNYIMQQPPMSATSSTLEQLSLQTNLGRDLVQERLRTGKSILEIPENRKEFLLGHPQSRKQAESLKGWFEDMLQKLEKEDLSKDKKSELKMNVYHATFLEVARQVSVQCLNRGELLKLLWSGFFKDLYLQLKKIKDEKDEMERKLRDEMDDQNLFYLDQLKRKNAEIDRQNQVIEDLKNKLLQKNKELEEQKVEAERWKLKCEKIMGKYKESKFKLMMADAKGKQDYTQTPRNKIVNAPRLDFTQLMSENNLKLFEQQSEGNSKSKKQSHRDIDVILSPDNEEASASNLGLSKPSDANLQVTKRKPRNRKDFMPSNMASPRVKPAHNIMMCDKQTDTSDFRDLYTKDKLCQTVGVGHMISNQAEEEFKQKNHERKESVIANVSFEQDIDNILISETKIFEEQQRKNNDNADELKRQLDERASKLQNRLKELQDKGEESQKELEKITQLEKAQFQQRGEPLKIQQTVSGDDIDINKNRTMQSFASGLKAGLMQKVINKLKENFKQKEVLIKQLIEENKDLFMQLDIEKAKFNQLVKYKDQDQSQLLDLQQRYENVVKDLKKAKTRHNYYKDLLHELSDLQEVKQKLNMSVSDVDKQEDTNDFALYDGKKGGSSAKKKFSKKKESLKAKMMRMKGVTSGFDGVEGMNPQSQLDIHKQGTLMQLNLDDWGLDNGGGSDVDFLIDELVNDDVSDIADTISQNSKRQSGSANRSKKQQKMAQKKQKVASHLSSHQFITKLVKKLHLPRFQRISCPLKNLLKNINACYLALINIYKNEFSDLKNSFTLKQSCVEFMYDQFMRGCGIKNIAEKKFAQTISAVMKFKDKIFRVKLFGNFLTLFDPMDKESFKFYLTCLNYILNISTFGYLVPNTDQDEIHYAPYIRVNDFMRNYFENRIGNEEYQELKIQIDKLKENDFKKNRNTYIVELDKALNILISEHQEMLHKQKGYVIEIFLALDHSQLEIMDFQSFYLLMLHVETKKFSFPQIKSFFEKNCEIIAIYSKKDSKKYLTIESFTALCCQEKLFSLDNQHRFWGIPDKAESDLIIEKVLKFKENFKKEIDNIMKRFYYVYQYFKDLIVMIQFILENTPTAKLQKKSKQIWTLIRLLEEESKRSYLDLHAQKYMGHLDVFTFVNIGWLALEEQRNVFDITFLKQEMIRRPSEKQADFTFSQISKLRPTLENKIALESSPTTRKNSARRQTRL